LLQHALSGTVEFVPSAARILRSVVLLTSGVVGLAFFPGSFSIPGATCAAGHAATEPAIPEPRALYQALNELRVDATHVYSVREINLRRDVVDLRLIEGKLAFFEPFDGRVTGAVFTGRGHILATPHDRGERQSLARFLGVPMLDQSFSRAYIRFTDDTAAELEQQLKSAGTTAGSDAEFAEGWGPLVGNLNPWHSIRILFDWLATQPLPYFYAGLQSDSVGAFDVLVDSRRDEQVLFGQPRFAGGARLYETWASFRAADAPPVPIETFAPLDYSVETTLAENLSLEGKTTLHIRSLRAGERVVPLELSRNLEVEGINLAGGAPLVHFQNEDLSRRDLLRLGNDILLVVLPAPAQAGEEFRLEVTYRGSVVSDAGNNVEFVGEHGTWYAHLGGGDHFTPFDLYFRWPKRFTLVATGDKIESQEVGDTKSGHWKSEVPFAVAGFNLGEYKVEMAGLGEPKIQLYANRQLEDAILARLHSQNLPSFANRGHPGFPLSNPGGGLPGGEDDIPPPSPAVVMKDLGSRISDSIHFFETLNGPFPFHHLDISQIPGNFGQGWPGLVYLSTIVFLTPGTQMRAGIGERTQVEARELLPFHEVAHQWWGNVVGAADYRDTWLEEAMANYLALLYADSKHANEHRMRTWLEHYRSELTAKIPGMNGIVDDAGPLSFGFRLSSSKAPNAYEAVTYGKGTWVIHMLREMMRDPVGKDPDARFRELLRSILAGHRFTAISTADFQHAVEMHMAPAMDLEGTLSMDWFFEEYVHETGIPHYAVEFQVKPRGQEFLVTGKIEQTGVDAVFTAPVPLYAGRPGGKLERLGTVVTIGPETRFHFISKVRPSKITVDPHLTLLCRTD